MYVCVERVVVGGRVLVVTERCLNLEEVDGRESESQRVVARCREKRTSESHA